MCAPNWLFNYSSEARQTQPGVNSIYWFLPGRWDTRTFSNSQRWWPQRQRWRVQSTRGTATIEVRRVQGRQVITQGKEKLFYDYCLPQVRRTCCDTHVKLTDQKSWIKYPTLAEMAKVHRDGKLSEVNTTIYTTYWNKLYKRTSVFVAALPWCWLPWWRLF